MSLKLYKSHIPPLEKYLYPVNVPVDAEKVEQHVRIRMLREVV